MKAIARRSTQATLTQNVGIRKHKIVVDEQLDQGGEDEGPSPQELLAASLASCTAITMEMYAKRKGWDIGPVEVSVDYATAERGSPTKFNLVLRLPSTCTPDQIEGLAQIAAKCPI